MHLWEKFKTMTEIDRLRRINLRDLKRLFDALAGVRKKLLSLWDKPDLWEAALTKVEAALQMEASFNSEYNPLTFKIQAKVDGRAEIYCLEFRWEFEGVKREQRVWVKSRPSNLIEGASCYYFVCPYTSRLCRKLYTDGRVLLSRYGFPHTYSARNYSHRWRNAKKVLDFMLFMETESNFTGRRDYYNGKLTRFGRKLRKIAGGEDYEEILARQRGTVEALYFAPRRGRPPKPENERKPRGGREQPPTPTLFTK